MQGLNLSYPRSGDGGRPARHVPCVPNPLPKPARGDPAPSRLAYRLNWMMLRPIIRPAGAHRHPGLLAALVAGIWLSDDTRRANLTGGIDGIDREKHQNRDAFMVTDDDPSRAPAGHRWAMLLAEASHRFPHRP